ncbi:MAG: TIM barrel protein [Oscillospiraceae bacterium]|nr:TIM barrel protein [Oscillospiraceae bacterium]
MKQLLMIPDLRELATSVQLAKRWSLGFEFNDFFSPAVLDNGAAREDILRAYSAVQLPSLRTMHGAFFDVIPCSLDHGIREVSALRIDQSIAAARAIAAGAVVFHTNYNPQLNTPAYIDLWLRENAAFWSGVLQRNPDISIYLENMFDTSPTLLEQLSQELSRCPNYGVCLDYAHASLSPTPCAVWAERLGRFVRHIHLNDNDLKSDLHLAWGDGKIDRSEFYRCYERYLQGASVLLEVSTLARAERSLAVLEADGFHCPSAEA